MTTIEPEKYIARRSSLTEADKIVAICKMSTLSGVDYDDGTERNHRSLAVISTASNKLSQHKCLVAIHQVRYEKRSQYFQRINVAQRNSMQNENTITHKLYYICKRKILFLL